MARKPKNIVDYFPHGVNNGAKMQYIEDKYRNDGYATWYKLLEYLGKSNNHYVDLNKKVNVLFLVGYCKVNEKTLFEIINDLVDLEEFDRELWEKGILWNQSFVDSISGVYSKRTAEIPQKGDIRHGNETDAELPPREVDRNTHSIVKYSKEDNSIVNNSKVKESKLYDKIVHDCFLECLNYFTENLHPNEKKKDLWLDTIEKLIRIDKIPPEKIIEIVKKTRAVDFWRANFLSLPKLRKTNPDGLKYIQVFNEKIKSNGKASKKERLQQTFDKIDSKNS